MDSMIDYLAVVSTDTETAPSPPIADKENKDRAMKARAVLNARTHGLPTLRREAIPLVPHLFDIPKDLAIISSFFVRHARKLGWPETRTNMTFFDELAANASEKGVHIILYAGNNDALIAHRSTEGMFTACSVACSGWVLKASPATE